MKNHDPHIQSLIALFMEGETTIEQEHELSEYFVNSTSIPKEWEAYREMFAFFDAGMPVQEEKPKHNILKPLWTLAAAAVVAIAIMVVPQLYRTRTNNKTTVTQNITADNTNVTTTDTTAKTAQPLTSTILAKQERETNKTKAHKVTHHSLPDSLEIEREKGEVEQAQQELMADIFIIEQERQEALKEQYITRAQTLQTQQAVQNENPQLIQVVFK